MADNFDVKQFLFENKLGSYSRLRTEDMGKDIEDAEAMKQMDFLAEDFKYFDDKDEFEKELFDKWPEAEKYKKEYEDGRIDYSDGYVNWGGWDPNRPNSPSGLPPGAVNQNVGMTARDIMYPPGSRMDEAEKMEETVDNRTLMTVEKLQDMLANLKSNTATNSNLPTTDKLGLLDAFQEMEELLEDIGADIEMEMDDRYASDYSKRRASELSEESVRMFKSDNPEGDQLVLRFLKGIAQKFNYPVSQAALFVKERIKKLGY